MTPTQWPMLHWCATESVGAMLGPATQLVPSIGIVSFMILQGQQKKADWLTFNI